MFPALRVIAVLHALSLFLQPVLAGFFLSGHDNLIDMHALNGMTLIALCLVQTVLAFLVWRKKALPRQVFTQSLGIFVLELVQLTIGYSHILWLHIPLGVALVVGTAMLMNLVMARQPLSVGAEATE